LAKRLLKTMFRQVRDANLNYHLIENGDLVAAGLSGGKDSLTMLYLLTLLQKYTPLQFKLLPIYVDLGWNNDISIIQDFCSDLGLDLYIEPTHIGQIVFDIRQESNPCSLCANLRRGALNRCAKKLGGNKVALGHHLDDVVDTLFLSILYEQRFHVFKPRTYLDRVDITVIRPLIYVAEKDIISFTEEYGLTVMENYCPADGTTRRSEINQLLDNIEQQHPGLRRKIVRSLENTHPDSLWGNQ